MPSRRTAAQNERYNERRRTGRWPEPADIDSTTTDRLAWAASDRMCAWCDDGPFIHPASHWFHAHGILSRDVKLRLEIPLTSSFVTDDLRARLSELAKSGTNLDNCREMQPIATAAAAVHNSESPTPLQQKRHKLLGETSLLRVVSGLTTDELAKLIALAKDRSSSGE